MNYQLTQKEQWFVVVVLGALIFGGMVKWYRNGQESGEVKAFLEIAQNGQAGEEPKTEEAAD